MTTMSSFEIVSVDPAGSVGDRILWPSRARAEEALETLCETTGWDPAGLRIVERDEPVSAGYEDDRGREIEAETWSRPAEGEWVPCGTVGTQRVAARRDDGEVTVSATETSDAVEDEGGARHWPAAECDHAAIRAAVERTLGVWVEPLSSLDWSDAEGDGEAVQSVALSDDQPTHRIEYRAGLNPADDAAPTSVDLVYLLDGAAYDHAEWDAAEHAAWTYAAAEGWLCQGQATPGGANGSVTVIALAGEA